MDSKMGNDHSSSPSLAGRRSVDAAFFRQVHSAHSSPRCSFPNQRIHKTSDTIPPSQHRLSTTDIHNYKPKPKLSLVGFESMGNQHGRRLSRTAMQLEGGADTGTSLVEALRLTQNQVQLLQSTWNKVKQSTSTFAQVFKLLCFKSPICREMFQKMSIVEGFRSNQCCDLNNHSKVLCDFMDSLLGDMSQPAKISQARCMDVGAAHVSMNEKNCASSWDQLGECLTEVLTKVDCIRSKRECVKAWISLISYLVDGMKCGYTDEWKRKQQTSRTSSCPFEQNGH